MKSLIRVSSIFIVLSIAFASESKEELVGEVQVNNTEAPDKQLLQSDVAPIDIDQIKKISDFFVRNMNEVKSTEALDYLKNRKLDGEDIKNYKLGFAEKDEKNKERMRKWMLIFFGIFAFITILPLLARI